MVEALEADPAAGVAYGDRAEERAGIHVRRIPRRLDELPGLPPARWPLAAMFRRATLLEATAAGSAALEEAAIWRGLADVEAAAVHLGEGSVPCVRPGAAGAETGAPRMRVLAGSSYRPLDAGEPEQLGLVIRSVRRPPQEMSREARVAVLIPCFNDGRFLNGAVDSIEESEPIDVVIADDHSTDTETVRVLEALQQEGVTVIRLEDHGGLPVARNRALRESSARFVFPLDAD